MTTIKELISLLAQAGNKIGYDMPVILEPNVNAEYGLFAAYDVINDKIDDLFLDIREAQRGTESRQSDSSDDKENYEEVVTYYDYWKSEEIPESDKKKVLCISSPAFKYGSEKNDF